jgi:ACT domain-containing protein
MMRIRRPARSEIVGRSCSQSVRQVKFASTVEADLICSAFDREHTAKVTVPAAKDKFEKGLQQFH